MKPVCLVYLLALGFNTMFCTITHLLPLSKYVPAAIHHYAHLSPLNTCSLQMEHPDGEVASPILNRRSLVLSWFWTDSKNTTQIHIKLLTLLLHAQFILSLIIASSCDQLLASALVIFP